MCLPKSDQDRARGQNLKINLHLKHAFQCSPPVLSVSEIQSLLLVLFIGYRYLQNYYDRE